MMGSKMIINFQEDKTKAILLTILRHKKLRFKAETFQRHKNPMVNSSYCYLSVGY